MRIARDPSWRHGKRSSGSLVLRALMAWALVLSIPASVSCAGAGGPRWDELLQEIRTRFPGVRQLSTAELASELESGEGPVPVLIDTRSNEEYAVSHLEGALHAESVGEIESVAPDRDARIVVYCSVGYRSSRLAEQLMEAGYTKVSNLEGSIFKWANEGRAVYRDGHAVAEVHPYDDDWGKLLERSLWRYPGE